VVTAAMACLATSSFRLSGATRMMIVSSLMERMMPRMPPAVVTRSPALIAASIDCHCFCRFCCGRIIKKYRTTTISTSGRIVNNPFPPPAACRKTKIAKLVTTLILCSPLSRAPARRTSGHRTIRPSAGSPHQKFVPGFVSGKTIQTGLGHFLLAAQRSGAGPVARQRQGFLPRLHAQPPPKSPSVSSSRQFILRNRRQKPHQPCTRLPPRFKKCTTR